MRHIFARLLVLIIFIGVGAGFVYLFLNYDSIERWAYLRSYSPAPEIVTLADKASLNSNGRELFYLSDPELKSKSEFNSYCQFPDRSLVLGCYTGNDGRIYILDVKEKRLEGVEAVTAAHEMLHAAYVELPDDERKRIDSLLKEQLNTIQDKRILELYDEYNSDNPEEAVNELHSIMGTEVLELNPELETYYSQYFIRRADLISVHKQYRQVFLDLEQRVANLQSELNALGKQIESYNTFLEETGPLIEQKLIEVNQYAEEGDADNYYPALTEYEGLIADYNQTVEQLNTTINQYNDLVEEINSTALRQNDLVNALDSKYSEKKSAE